MRRVDAKRALVTLGPWQFILSEVPEGVEVRDPQLTGTPMLADFRTLAAAKKWVVDETRRRMRAAEVSLHRWSLEGFQETEETCG